MNSHLRSHHGKRQANRSIAQSSYTATPYTVSLPKTPVFFKIIQIDLSQKGVCNFEIIHTMGASYENFFQCTLFIDEPGIINFYSVKPSDSHGVFTDGSTVTLADGEEWHLSSNHFPKLRKIRLQVGRLSSTWEEFDGVKVREVLSKIGKIDISLLGTFKK